MRQRCWLELVKEYDCDINYHLGKDNTVADALNRKSFGSLTTLRMLEKTLQGDFCRLGIELITWRLSTMMLQSTFLEKIKQRQKEDPELIGHKEVWSQERSQISVFLQTE